MLWSLTQFSYTDWSGPRVRPITETLWFCIKNCAVTLETCVCVCVCTAFKSSVLVRLWLLISLWTWHHRPFESPEGALTFTCVQWNYMDEIKSSQWESMWRTHRTRNSQMHNPDLSLLNLVGSDPLRPVHTIRRIFSGKCRCAKHFNFNEQLLMHFSAINAVIIII